MFESDDIVVCVIEVSSILNKNYRYRFGIRTHIIAVELTIKQTLTLAVKSMLLRIVTRLSAANRKLGGSQKSWERLLLVRRFCFTSRMTSDWYLWMKKINCPHFATVNVSQKAGNIVHSGARKSGTMLLQSKIIPPPFSGGQMVQLLHAFVSFPIFGMQEFSLIVIRFLLFFNGDDDFDESPNSFAVDAVLPNISSSMLASGTDPGRPVNKPKHTGLKISGKTILKTLES